MAGLVLQFVQHTIEKEVQALFNRVREELGKLDILVKDTWGSDSLIEFLLYVLMKLHKKSIKLLDNSMLETGFIATFYKNQIFFPSILEK